MVVGGHVARAKLCLPGRGQEDRAGSIGGSRVLPVIKGWKNLVLARFGGMARAFSPTLGGGASGTLSICPSILDCCLYLVVT